MCAFTLRPQLNQYGKDVKEQEGVQDHDLLMEILEARETLEEASDAEEIEEIRDENHGESSVVQRQRARRGVCPHTV